MKNSEAGAEVEPKRSSSVAHHEERIGIVLPCEVSKFGEFISGLLGRKQTIEGSEQGTFEIEQRDIINTFNLIHQRVEAQNTASLAAFSLKVIYNNGNSVTHNTIPSFESHHPIEPCHPIEVVLHLTYLVEFKGSTVPEKQSIEVSFTCYSHPWKDPRPRRYVMEGAIEYRIEYTERTWGSDLASIVANHARTLVHKSGGFRSWITDNNDQLARYGAAVLAVASIGAWACVTSSNSEALAASVSSMIQYGAWSLLVMSALAALLWGIAYTFENYVFLGSSSFLVLVDRDRKHVAKRRKRQRQQYLIAISAWVMAVAGSVVASFIYSHLAG